MRWICKLKIVIQIYTYRCQSVKKTFVWWIKMLLAIKVTCRRILVQLQILKKKKKSTNTFLDEMWPGYKKKKQIGKVLITFQLRVIPLDIPKKHHHQGTLLKPMNKYFLHFSHDLLYSVHIHVYHVGLHRFHKHIL